jgi:hypothetical protein
MPGEITQNTHRNKKGVVYIHFHIWDLGITCLSLNQTNCELGENIVGCVWERIGNKKIHLGPKGHQVGERKRPTMTY